MQNMYPLANPEQTNLHAVFPLDEVLPTGWMIALRKNLLRDDSKKKYFFQRPITWAYGNILQLLRGDSESSPRGLSYELFLNVLKKLYMCQKHL